MNNLVSRGGSRTFVRPCTLCRCKIVSKSFVRGALQTVRAVMFSASLPLLVLLSLSYHHINRFDVVEESDEIVGMVACPTRAPYQS